MNKHKQRILAVLLGASLVGTVTVAHAQGRSDNGHGGRGGPPAKAQSKGGGHGNDKGPQRGPDGNPGRGGPPGQAGPGWHGDPPPHRWARGDKVPLPYRGHQYVIEDWRGYRLAPPPRGYHWIGVGADYFLVGVATGVVLQAVLGN
ncbi:RcnB family protein [Bordetella sp. 2513F-2]